MNFAATIIVSDSATPAIDDKIAKCSPRRLGAIIGQPLAQFWRNRLAGLGENKKGWPSTHFFERAARSVTHEPNAYGVTLSAEQVGLRQRWKGGAIAPVNKAALAIPISPVSYGKTPADFPGLFLLKTKKGAYLVQAGEEISEKTGRTVNKGRKLGGNAGRRIRAALNFLFILSSGVNQVGDPRVVPTNDEFAEVAMASIELAVQ